MTGAQAMTQSYANHRRFVPPFHFFVLPVLLLNAIWSIIRVFRGYSWENLLSLLVATALVIVALCARLFALKAQDRVIRLEERMRLTQVLPADLRPRIGEFSPEQLIALRFASDEELPDLARKVLTEKIEKRDPIKKLVKNWRADLLRV
jgi:hypothetical protein